MTNCRRITYFETPNDLPVPEFFRVCTCFLHYMLILAPLVSASDVLRHSRPSLSVHCPLHSFCNGRKAAAGTPQAPHSVERSVPPLSSPRGPLEAEESETYVSICDATGVFSILGMFWRNGKSSTLCNLMVDLAKV